MEEENIKELVIALSMSASEEYQQFRLLARKSHDRKTRDYYLLRARESLNFFEDSLFVLSFGEERGKYIKEQLNNEEDKKDRIEKEATNEREEEF